MGSERQKFGIKLIHIFFPVHDLFDHFHSCVRFDFGATMSSPISLKGNLPLSTANLDRVPRYSILIYAHVRSFD
jgi:hypothetical protein